jgi:hypothetical protein
MAYDPAMPFPAPPAPAFAPDHAATTTGPLRYEDLTQGGHLMPIALTHALDGLWRDVLRKHAGAHAARKTGVVPLLTRMTLASTEAAIRVDQASEARAGFELAYSRDDAGDVARLYLNCWSEVRGAPRAAAGDLVLAGHMFAEHTFTRPFAPPAQRRVTELDAPGFPRVPEARYAAPPPATAGDAPVGARWLDELAPDPTEVCFGLDHTDSNQHVNSLVYIRVFLEAVQRRVAAAGRSHRVRSRVVDIAYRKPCFAGERVRTSLRLFEHAGTLGAAGFIASTDGDDGKPRCYVRVVLAE